MTFSTDQRERYARQLSLPEIGEAGQKKLAAGRVLLVGLGGLGSPAATYLAVAGVGSLRLVDGDRVDASNLQRQILHGTADVGRLKVESAAEQLRMLNPDVSLEAHPQHLHSGNAWELVHGCDFVIDATDNAHAKFLIADTCHDARVSYSHAGIQRFRGQTMTVRPGHTACVRCIFENPPDATDADAQPAGPLGVLPGIIGTIQAAEALKHILGIGALLYSTMLTFDALALSFRRVPVARRQDCQLCG